MSAKGRIKKERDPKQRGTPALIGVAAALASSLCCITPVLAIVAGLSGFASAFSWLHPFEPYLYSIAIGSLIYAWYRELMGAKREGMECDGGQCAPCRSSGRRTWLGGATVLAVLMMTFPLYSGSILPSNEVAGEELSRKGSVEKKVLSIEGMTCTGCEKAVDRALTSKEGVTTVSSDHEKGQAIVEFHPGQVRPRDLKNAVENDVGYRVTDMNPHPKGAKNDE